MVDSPFLMGQRGLFVGYGLMQSNYPEAWVAGHHHLDRIMGAINTVHPVGRSFLVE